MAMNIIEQLEKEEIARLGKTIPDFAPGDTVVVNVNVVEGERRRADCTAPPPPNSGSSPEWRFQRRPAD
jgi:hypothetical protein